jgi:hypothetical protein
MLYWMHYKLSRFVIAGLTRNLLIVFGIGGLRVKPAMTFSILLRQFESKVGHSQMHPLNWICKYISIFYRIFAIDYCYKNQ